MNINNNTKNYYKRENPLPFPGTHPNLEMRSRDIWNSPEFQQDNMILTIVVHGTGGQDTEYYFKDNDPNFEAIKSTVAWIATCSKKKTELLSFKWSGDLDSDKRQETAKYLQRYLKSHDSYKTAYKIVFTHSHGGNIINTLTNFMRINTLIFFACPRRSELLSNPDKFDNLLYFYSDNDWTTVAGRTNGNKVFKPAILKGGFGAALYAVSKSITTTNLPLSIACDAAFVGAKYMGCWFINDFGKEVPKLTNGTNLFPLQSGKTMASIRILMDGSGPGHSDTIYAVRHLPHILQILHNDYPHHFLNGSVFDLHMQKNGNDMHLCLAQEETKKLREMSATYVPPITFGRFKEKNSSLILDILDCEFVNQNSQDLIAQSSSYAEEQLSKKRLHELKASKQTNTKDFLNLNNSKSSSKFSIDFSVDDKNILKPHFGIPERAQDDNNNNSVNNSSQTISNENPEPFDMHKWLKENHNVDNDTNTSGGFGIKNLYSSTIGGIKNIGSMSQEALDNWHKTRKEARKRNDAAYKEIQEKKHIFQQKFKLLEENIFELIRKFDASIELAYHDPQFIGCINKKVIYNKMSAKEKYYREKFEQVMGIYKEARELEQFVGFMSRNSLNWHGYVISIIKNASKEVPKEELSVWKKLFQSKRN